MDDEKNFTMLPSRYSSIPGFEMRGGFGSVTKIFDTYLGREVLFKSMQDPQNNDQLLNETRFLSKARSRHVVEIYDIVLDHQGLVCGIIIEFLQGRDYVEFYKEFSVETKNYLKILYQITAALSDLHEVGITHRDLKLENFKNSKSGVLKLFDFGIASPSADYRTKNNRGTYTYAAPELYIENSTITSEADIYAFGVCAWLLASNAIPDALEERPPQSRNSVPSLDIVLPGYLPAEIVEMVNRCLNVDPAERPTARNLSNLLGRYLSQGRHKGIFVDGQNQIYELSASKPNVLIKISPLGELAVRYDGLVFSIYTVSGDVYVNNRPATVGMELHEACVITFGGVEKKSYRRWVTFSSSHPEVLI